MTILAPKYEVLVVDDSPVYHKLFEQMLSGPTYSLSFARDGNHALRLYQEKSPNIIITDWIMPEFPVWNCANASAPTNLRTTPTSF